MRIIHCGVQNPVMDLLARSQERAGHQVERCDASGLDALSHEVNGGTIVLHGAEFYSAQHAPVIETLARAREDGVTVIHLAYEIMPYIAPGECPPQAETLVPLQSVCHHTCISSPTFSSLLGLHTVTWLPLGIETSGRSTVPDSGPLGTLRVGVIAGHAVSEARAAVAAVQTEGVPVALTQLGEQSLMGTAGQQELSQLDILIERTDGVGFGLSALLALARGLTVLTGNPEAQRRLSPELQFSPILHVGPGDLQRRLIALARERRSMRDLSRRGIQFIGDYHQPSVMCARINKKCRQRE